MLATASKRACLLACLLARPLGVRERTHADQKKKKNDGDGGVRKDEHGLCTISRVTVDHRRDVSPRSFCQWIPDAVGLAAGR